MISIDNVIKGKIDNTIFEALKQILNYKKITQQEFIENAVKDFILKNLDLIIKNENKENKGLK